MRGMTFKVLYPIKNYFSLASIILFELLNLTNEQIIILPFKQQNSLLMTNKQANPQLFLACKPDIDPTNSHNLHMLRNEYKA